MGGSASWRWRRTSRACGPQVQDGDANVRSVAGRAPMRSAPAPYDAAIGCGDGRRGPTVGRRLMAGLFYVFGQILRHRPASSHRRAANPSARQVHESDAKALFRVEFERAGNFASRAVDVRTVGKVRLNDETLSSSPHRAADGSLAPHPQGAPAFPEAQVRPRFATGQSAPRRTQPNPAKPRVGRENLATIRSRLRPSARLYKWIPDRAPDPSIPSRKPTRRHQMKF